MAHHSNSIRCDYDDLLRSSKTRRRGRQHRIQILSNSVLDLARNRALRSLHMRWALMHFIRKFYSLPTKERKILELRYGLTTLDITMGIESHTLQEVAKEFGVTRERIRQLECKAFERLGTHI